MESDNTPLLIQLTHLVSLVILSSTPSLLRKICAKMFTSLMLSTNIFSYQSGSSPEKKESHVSLAISASSSKYQVSKLGSEVVSFSRGEIRSGGQGSAEGVVGDGAFEE